MGPKKHPRNPYLTVDIVIEMEEGGVVFISRRNPPHGWALPGGFVDYGETVAAAAVREAREETGLEVALTDLLQVYSDPSRDPRHHTVSVVFIGIGTGKPMAADDARDITVCDPRNPPGDLCFDHQGIIEDYLTFRRSGLRPPPDKRR